MENVQAISPPVQKGWVKDPRKDGIRIRDAGGLQSLLA